MTRDAGTPAAGRRLAGAPISWGVCEVPGWGRQLPPGRVLAEMAALGLAATELGAEGWLPSAPEDLRRILDGHGLALVGGFVPLVLHEPSADAALRTADEVAVMLAAADADVFVAALVMDDAWSLPARLDDTRFDRLTRRLGEVAAIVEDRGLGFCLHPHAGTLVETAADIERMLGETDVGWCLDTGHLQIGGADPVAFARDHGDRIV